MRTQPGGSAEAGTETGAVTDPDGLTRLVRASAGGSEAAWDELVHRFTPLVRFVIQGYRLSAEDARDVSQTVWLRLVEHLAGLRDPQALPRWLTATTRNECCRQLRHGQRVRPADPHQDEHVGQQAAAGTGLEAGLLLAELRQAMRDGLGQLPARDQWLLRLRAGDPPASYQEISRLLGMPVGSVGPTLRRCLDRLRETAPMRAYLAA